MDDSFFMCRLESIGDLCCDLQRFVERYWTTCETLCESRSFDEFHHNGPLFEAEDRRNVGMTQCCKNFRFAIETGKPSRILSECLGENFDGHFAPEFRVAGAIDFTHSSSA